MSSLRTQERAVADSGRWFVQRGEALGLSAGTLLLLTGPHELGALLLAHQQVPRSVTAGERPRMAVSAAWVVVGVALYVGVPVVLNRL